MTPRLPNLTSRQLVSALKRAGFDEVRQKGSHLQLKHIQTDVVLTIPLHSGDIKRPLLKAILRQAGLTDDEFASFL